MDDQIPSTTDSNPAPIPSFYLSSSDSSEDLSDIRNMIQDLDTKLTRKIDQLDAKINQLNDVIDNLLMIGIIVVFVSLTY